MVSRAVNEMRCGGGGRRAILPTPPHDHLTIISSILLVFGGGEPCAIETSQSSHDCSVPIVEHPIIDSEDVRRYQDINNVVIFVAVLRHDGVVSMATEKNTRRRSKSRGPTQTNHCRLVTQPPQSTDHRVTP